MKQNILLIIAFILFANTAGFSQTGSGISGYIKDETGKSLRSSTVFLMSAADSVIIKTAITDAKGFYYFQTPKAGNYFVSASLTGYKKLISKNFSIVSGSESTVIDDLLFAEKTVKSLEDVVVKSQKSFVEVKADRTVVNVENSITSTGGTVFDVLQKAPGVVVDNNENLTLRGKEGLLILIDGKQSFLAGQELVSYLKSLPSNSVEKLEIFSNPPAQFEAAGNAGVINISTKRIKKKGYNGQFTLGTGFIWNTRYNSDLSLNYAKNKLGMFFTGSYQNFNSERTIGLKRTINYNGVSSFFDQFNRRQSETENLSFKFGMDYNVSKKGTLGFSTSFINNKTGLDSKSTTDIDNAGAFEDNFLAVSFDSKQKWFNTAGNLNYRVKLDTSGTSLSFDADYSYYRNKRQESYINTLSDKNAVINTQYLRNKQPVDISVYSFKADYSGKAWKKYSLDLGVKSSYVITNNLVAFDTLQNQSWVPYSNFTNNFNYKENINAVYGNLRREFKKFSYQLGLRVEQTNSDGLSETQNKRIRRSYTDFFPTVFIGYKISNTQSARISYGRRIDRPTYQNLNPFIFFLDQYTYYQGNPFLNPQYSDNIELSYQIKQYSISTGFSHTNSLMSFITTQNDSTKVGIASHYNLNNRYNYFVSTTLPLKITTWWSSFNNINAYYTTIKSFYLGDYYTRSVYGVQAVSNNTFSLPKNIKIELNWLYVSPQVFGISKSNPYYVLSGGIRFSAGKNKWDIRANIVDILNTDKGSGGTSFQNQQLKFAGRTKNSLVRLSLAYKFGSNGTKQSKARSGLEEESKRVNFNAQ